MATLGTAILYQLGRGRSSRMYYVSAPWPVCKQCFDDPLPALAVMPMHAS